MNKPAREYIPIFTPLRGIAAMLIVMEHFKGFFPIIGEVGLPTKNHMWVDFFFILSGFVLTLSYAHLFEHGCTLKNYRHFIGRRLIRLYPVHFVTLIAMVLVEIYRVYVYTQMNTEIVKPPFTDNWQDDRSIPTLITNVFLVQSWYLYKNISWNQPSWSISCEFFIALIFPLMLNALYKKKAVIVPLALCILGYCWIYWSDIPGNYFNFTVMHSIFGSGCGVILCKLYQRQKDQSKFLGNSALLMAVLLLCLYYLEIFVTQWYIIPMFCILVYGSAHNRGFFHTIIMNPVFQFLGKISYSIYLVHFVVLNTLNLVILYNFNIYADSPTFTTMQRAFMCLFYIGVTIALSTICYHLFERWVPKLLSGPSEGGKLFVRQYETPESELIEKFSQRMQENAPVNETR